MLLLQAVASVPEPAAATAAGLAEHTGLNRATAWRILSTLEEHGMVACDRTTGAWSIGLGMVEIARMAGLDAVVHSAHHVLEQVALQTGETAALAILRVGELTYIDEVVSRAVVSASWAGRVVPLHATSTGKALLAFTAPTDRDRLLDCGPGRPAVLQRYTSRTITDPDELEAELQRTHDRGYSICRGEFDPDAYGVSACVLAATGVPLAVVSIWGPRSRVTEDRYPALGELIRAAADDIGGRPRR